MKTKILCGFAVLLFFGRMKATRTFFSVPVPFQPASVERQTMLHNQLRDYTIEKWKDFSVTFFGGQSVDSCKLARYFLPFDKTQLVAAGFGSPAGKTNSADLIAHYFDVLTGSPRSTSGEQNNIFDVINTWTFQSTLSFSPVQKYFGLGLLYHQHLSSDLDCGWWLELAMPIMCVKNTMGMCESINSPKELCTQEVPEVESFFSSDSTIHAKQCMTSAFASSVFRFGRIDARESAKTQWGVADLEATIGYTFLREHYYHLHGRAGVLIPTGNTPTAKFLFERIIGNNGHMGFFAGLFGGIKVWEHNENFLALELDTNLTTFLNKIQIRAIDLQGKPWGRYIWVYPNNLSMAQLSPGINFFTKSVNVSHGAIGDFNLAGVYTMSHFQGELGYHCYARDKEDLSLATCWQAVPGLGAIWYSNNSFLTTSNTRVTRSSATINNYEIGMNDVKEFKATNTSTEQKDNDAFKAIARDQLDLESAAHPAIIVNTLYMSLGYAWYDATYPVLINLAGAYEFGRGNAVMDRWKLWGKLGVSF